MIFMLKYLLGASAYIVSFRGFLLAQSYLIGQRLGVFRFLKVVTVIL